MPDKDKTIAVLLKELEQARRRIAELELASEKVREAQESIKGQEEYFRIHFSLSNDILFSYDYRYTLNYISPNVERLLGYKPEELLGKKIQDLLFLIDASDHNEVVEDATHALSGKTIMYSIYRFIARDGSMKFAEVSGIPIVRNNKVMAVISVARQMAGNAVQEKPKDKAPKPEELPAGLNLSPRILLDSAGIVLYLNDEAAKILGKNAHELLGSSIFHHSPEELVRKRRMNFEKTMATGLSESFLEEYQGKVFYNTLYPIHDERGKVFRVEFNLKELSSKIHIPTETIY
jgi:PAS domain S-box-containing protein